MVVRSRYRRHESSGRREEARRREASRLREALRCMNRRHKSGEVS